MVDLVSPHTTDTKTTNKQTDTRDRVLFLTAGIVLLTILINGTTCKHLLNYLGASP